MIAPLPLVTASRAAAPRASPAGVFEYVSPSRLSLWLRCPLAFRLRYLDGVTSPSTPSLLVGKVVHAALARWYRGRQYGRGLSPEQIVAAVPSLWEEHAAAEPVAFAKVEEEREARDQAGRLVGAYLAERPGGGSALDLNETPLAVEATIQRPLVDPFTGENLGLPLLGIVDLVLAEPAGPLVVDFKTASRGGEPLEITHEVQLSCYAWLLRQCLERPESGLEIRQLVKTKSPRVESFRYEPRQERHFRRLFALLRAYLDDLHAGRFIFRPGLACSLCDHRATRCLTWPG